MAKGERPATQGELNYIITCAIHSYVMECGTAYVTINGVVGVLECVKQEFYRVVATPFEEGKRLANGPVSWLDRIRDANDHAEQRIGERGCELVQTLASRDNGWADAIAPSGTNNEADSAFGSDTSFTAATFYANVEKHIPSDWMNLAVDFWPSNIDTSLEPTKDFHWLEVNTKEGWGVRYVKGPNGEAIVHRDGEAITERVEGTFKLRYLNEGAQ